MAIDKHHYELMYIVNSVLSDSQIKDLVTRVTQYISEGGGEIVEVNEWGSRRLAYPLQKKRNGYYVNMFFKAPGAFISKIERALEIDDNILRYITLRMDTKMVKHYEETKKAPATA